jgi:alginate O-acetyltransferase complex protein AlgI
MYGFALVIYADFSGYSDIARGSARLLGVELVRNFEQPYLSRNITEFWRRWHISLSDWLRDYLYIPLGGNRGGRLRTYRNLALTMLLGGLWHGASWTFVVWGGAHGLLLALERLTGRSAPTREQVGPGDLGSILLTFHAVSVIWILFRADSFATAGDFLLGLIRVEPGSPGLELAGLVVVMAVVLVTVDVAQRRTGRHDVFTALAPPVRGVLLGAAIVAVILASGRPAVPFIYFQF